MTLWPWIFDIPADNPDIVLIDYSDVNKSNPKLWGWVGGCCQIFVFDCKPDIYLSVKFHKDRSQHNICLGEVWVSVLNGPRPGISVANIIWKGGPATTPQEIVNHFLQISSFQISILFVFFISNCFYQICLGMSTSLLRAKNQLTQTPHYDE